MRAKFNANPDFFGKPPPEPEIIVNFITDNSTLLLQARNGNADVTLGLSKASVASLVGHEGLQIIAVETARWQLIGLPNEIVPFDNPKFREALSYAVRIARSSTRSRSGTPKSFMVRSRRPFRHTTPSSARRVRSTSTGRGR